MSVVYHAKTHFLRWIHLYQRACTQTKNTYINGKRENMPPPPLNFFLSNVLTQDRFVFEVNQTRFLASIASYRFLKQDFERYRFRNYLKLLARRFALLFLANRSGERFRFAGARDDLQLKLDNAKREMPFFLSNQCHSQFRLIGQ